MTATSVLGHLKSFSRELYTLDRKPLLDLSFAFPWETLAGKLSETLGCTFKISPSTPEWKRASALETDIPSPRTVIAIALPGIRGQLQLIISTIDIESIMTEVLKIDTSSLAQEDATFCEQFTHFLIAELVACAQSIAQIQPLSPKLTIPEKIQEPGALCRDLSFACNDHTSRIRVVISSAFLDSWKEARKNTVRSVPLEDISATLQVEAGRTFLSPKEICSLRQGDVLLLDYPFLIPESPKSRIFLTYQGKPLFRAKLKDKAVQILEMPLQHEAFTPIGGYSMAPKAIQPPKEPLEESSPLPDPTGTETEALNPFEGEEDPEESAPLTQEEMQAASTISPDLIKEPLKVDEIPLTVVANLSEITMSVAQLTALQPGNLLDLNIQPENGVSLVVNNRVFASGNLVLIGDHVGVEITQIGLTPTS